MQNLNEQIEKIHNDIAEIQWKITWGKSIEETVREIVERCIQNN